MPCVKVRQSPLDYSHAKIRSVSSLTGLPVSEMIPLLSRVGLLQRRLDRTDTDYRGDTGTLDALGVP